MAKSDEVPDDQKDVAHTVPMDVWERIRAEAERRGKDEGAGEDPPAGDQT